MKKAAQNSMQKQSGDQPLPPAAMYGRIKWHKDEPGCICVALRYVDEKRAHRESYVRPRKDFMGGPYEKWEANIGRVAKLWKWHGTGEGMIGGPVKREIACIMWGGPNEFPEHHNKASLQKALDDLVAWEKDSRYEFSKGARSQLQRKIRMLKIFVSQPRWNRMNWLQRMKIQGVFCKDEF